MPAPAPPRRVRLAVARGGPWGLAAAPGALAPAAAQRCAAATGPPQSGGAALAEPSPVDGPPRTRAEVMRQRLAEAEERQRGAAAQREQQEALLQASGGVDLGFDGARRLAARLRRRRARQLAHNPALCKSTLPDEQHLPLDSAELRFREVRRQELREWRKLHSVQGVFDAVQMALHSMHGQYIDTSDLDPKFDNIRMLLRDVHVAAPITKGLPPNRRPFCTPLENKVRRYRAKEPVPSRYVGRDAWTASGEYTARSSDGSGSGGGGGGGGEEGTECQEEPADPAQDEAAGSGGRADDEGTDQATSACKQEHAAQASPAAHDWAGEAVRLCHRGVPPRRELDSASAWGGPEAAGAGPDAVCRPGYQPRGPKLQGAARREELYRAETDFMVGNFGRLRRPPRPGAPPAGLVPGSLDMKAALLEEGKHRRLQAKQSKGATKHVWGAL